MLKSSTIVSSFVENLHPLTFLALSSWRAHEKRGCSHVWWVAPVIWWDAPQVKAVLFMAFLSLLLLVRGRYERCALIGFRFCAPWTRTVEAQVPKTCSCTQSLEMKVCAALLSEPRGEGLSTQSADFLCKHCRLLPNLMLSMSPGDPSNPRP